MAKIKSPKKSPRIYRLFTESPKKFFKKYSRILTSLKLQVSIFLLGFFIITILVIGLDLLLLLQKQKASDFERAKLNSEIALWQNIVQKYPSRDNYFRLAQLEYRVGDIGKSKLYTDKALYLDPNYTQAKKFKKLLQTSY